jgi:hypothetical protein
MVDIALSFVLAIEDRPLRRFPAVKSPTLTPSRTDGQASGRQPPFEQLAHRRPQLRGDVPRLGERPDRLIVRKPKNRALR